MSRAAMTMRATVSHDSDRPNDDWGRPEPPVGTEQRKQVPCRVWSKMRRDVTDEGKSVVIEDLRAIVPHDAIIAEGDRLTTITNRQGVELYAGPIAVETITRRGSSGSSPGHLELMLTRHV